MNKILSFLKQKKWWKQSSETKQKGIWMKRKIVWECNGYLEVGGQFVWMSDADTLR